MKQNTMITIIAVAVAVGAGGFFAGMKYQQTRGMRMMGNGGPGGANVRQFGAGGNGSARGGAFRPTSGTVVSVDSTSMTVKLQDGSTKIVLLTDKTQINKAAAGTTADLTADTRVAVFGTDNADGSVTAQSVQINPQEMRMGGAPNSAAKSTDAKEIVISGSDYTFAPTAITVKKGEKTRIVFKNNGGMHDFVVDELGIKTAVINGGEEDFVEFTPEKVGTFEFYCSVMTHRTMGMVGKITVQ
jgi:plastocyanin